MRGKILTVALSALMALSMGCEHFKREKHDGETKHVHMSAADLPKAVSDGFTRDHPGATIREVEKETYADGTVHYEVKYTTPDGKQEEVEYDAKGEELEKH
jgi:YD repeat-containing protein